MGKKHGMNPKKKPGKSENYKAMNQAYELENYPPFSGHYLPHTMPQQYQAQSFSDEAIMLNWNHSQPKQYYDYLVKLYGNPNVLGHNKGGIAIWNTSMLDVDPLTGMSNIYKKIEIRDEEVSHKCPAEHIDFVYSYLNIPITPKQLEDIIKLSGSVNYDMLKQELFARCGSLEANIATLYMCSHIIMSHIDKNPKYMTIDYIHENDEYAKHINSTTDSEFVKEMYKELINNINTIRRANKLPGNYWPGAFNSSCGKPNN